jgi:hypothetical protein
MPLNPAKAGTSFLKGGARCMPRIRRMTALDLNGRWQTGLLLE